MESLWRSPTIPELNKLATPTVAGHWYSLGLELLDSQYKEALDIIKRNHKGNVYRCCIKMFSKWLSTSDTATWNHLIEAIRRIDLGDVANNIQSGTNSECLHNHGQCRHIVPSWN